jgi:hypothetical protein
MAAEATTSPTGAGGSLISTRPLSSFTPVLVGGGEGQRDDRQPAVRVLRERELYDHGYGLLGEWG